MRGRRHWPASCLSALFSDCLDGLVEVRRRLVAPSQGIGRDRLDHRRGGGGPGLVCSHQCFRVARLCRDLCFGGRRGLRPLRCGGAEVRLGDGRLSRRALRCWCGRRWGLRGVAVVESASEQPATSVTTAADTMIAALTGLKEPTRPRYAAGGPPTCRRVRPNRDTAPAVECTPDMILTRPLPTFVTTRPRPT